MTATEQMDKPISWKRGKEQALLLSLSQYEFYRCRLNSPVFPGTLNHPECFDIPFQQPFSGI